MGREKNMKFYSWCMEGSGGEGGVKGAATTLAGPWFDCECVKCRVGYVREERWMRGLAREKKIWTAIDQRFKDVL